MKHKRCTRCLRRKPWSEFYAKVRWPDGSTRQPHSRCKRCHNEVMNDPARRRSLRLADPEAARRRERENYRRMRKDPERLARRRKSWREGQRRRLGLAVQPIDDKRPELLPVAPFRAWLEQIADRFETDFIMAEALGIGDRRLRAILTGEQQRVSLDTVDRALTNEGSTPLDELYPYEAVA